MAVLARRLRPLAVAIAAVAVVAAGSGGCDCSNVAYAPNVPGCFVTDDCAIGLICSSGSCVAPLPAEGEGEGSEGEGEGEGSEGEGEGEGEGASALIAAPPSLTLPTTEVGVAVDGTVQIVNVGDAPLTITSVSSSDARFTVSSPTAGTSVGASSSATMAVRFAANAPGAFSSTITVRAGAASTTVSVAASATQPTVDGTLVVRAGPDDDGVGLADCACSTAISPANVDLAYVAPTSTCRKPSSLSCGIADNCAPCDLGAQGRARWRSGRTERPRETSGDLPWIVDEEIVHDGAGADGDFGVQLTLVDDCTTSPASLAHSANLSCCAFFDCEQNDVPGPQACFDYVQPTSCVTDCNAFVTAAEAQDCMARGPVLVRARIKIDDVERDLCVTMTRNESLEVARVRRTSGAFAVTGLGAGVREVAADAPCP